MIRVSKISGIAVMLAAMVVPVWAQCDACPSCQDATAMGALEADQGTASDAATEACHGHSEAPSKSTADLFVQSAADSCADCGASCHQAEAVQPLVWALPCQSVTGQSLNDFLTDVSSGSFTTVLAQDSAFAAVPAHARIQTADPPTLYHQHSLLLI